MRQFKPGDNTTIRFPKDYPDYAIRFLNEAEIPLTDIILIGIQAIQVGGNNALFLQYDGLTPEKKKRLENPDLQRLITKWIDEVVFADRPLGPIKTDENE